MGSTLLAMTGFSGAQPRATQPSPVAETGAEAGTPGDPADTALYLRIAAGAGLVGFDMHPEPGYEDHSADGASVALDLLLGYSPSRRTAFGGALLLDLAPSMTLASGPMDRGRSTMGIGIIGPFIDAAPEPAWGLHLGLAAGFAVLSIHPPGEPREPIYGLGGAAWAGNDFSIGHDWSLGGSLRVSRTLTGDDSDEFDLDASCLTAALLLTAAHD